MGKAAWLAALSALLLGILVVEIEQFRVLERMARHMPEIQVPSDALVTSWKSGGDVVTVTTTREVGESDAALLVRHTAEVKAKLAEKPIDH